MMTPISEYKNAILFLFRKLTGVGQRQGYRHQGNRTKFINSLNINIKVDTQKRAVRFLFLILLEHYSTTIYHFDMPQFCTQNANVSNKLSP